MKNFKNTKIFAIVIALMLLVSCAIAIGASADAEALSDASLSIYKKNVSFQNSPQLVFAVAYENCNPADITLDVWYGEKSGAAQTVESYGNVNIGGKTYPAFAINPQNPKDIDALVYVQAKVGSVVSEVERYSILEYAWSGITTAANKEDADRYHSILTYSESIQKWLTDSGKFDGTPVMNYFYVKAEGVALDASGYDSGIFTSPVTFTLGESALGWTVETFKDGVKTTETKAGGATITVSASTRCTKIEAVKPQAVSGNPLDFDKISIASKGNGGADTTFLVGSSLSTAKSGTIAAKDANGNDATVYYFDSDAGKSDSIRIQSHGNDVDDKVDKSANAFIFDTDMKIDYAEGTQYGNSAIEIKLGNSGTSSVYGYFFVFYLDDATGKLKMLDSGARGNGSWVVTDVAPGEWFNMRVEYYKIAADEMLTLVFFNDKLTYVSNNVNKANANGDDAWPVYSDGYKASNGSTYKGINAGYISANSATDVSIYLDNTLMRRTALTPPTVPESLYNSTYTPAN